MATDTTAPVAPELRLQGNWKTKPQVSVTTSLGKFVAELEPNAAPITSANFLAYVNTGFYTNLIVHRVAPGFVIQGGGFDADLVEKPTTYAPIVLESNKGLANLRGTLAMARTSDPNSATSQFYVNLVKNSFLDYSAADPGYAVFGKVVSGLAVVDAIGRVATASRNGFDDVPTAAVVIKSAAQTTLGAVYSSTGKITLAGLESGARWEYSVDNGAHWKAASGSSFTLATGAYEYNQLLVHQRDAAGNVSRAGKPGADLVVNSHAVIMGNAKVNALSGTAGNDFIYGLGSADTLNGGAGNDLLDGGSGADAMNGGTGNDLYYVRDGGDTTLETNANPVLGGVDSVYSFLGSRTLGANIENGRIMTSGSANLTGNALDNLLFAGSGNNVLAGSGGDDTVSYAFGLPGTTGVTVTLAKLTAQATGGSGSDTLLGIENLIGSRYADRLTGNTHDNVLDGGAGNDTLKGGDGNDTYVVGNAGDVVSETNPDPMTGGIDTVNSLLASYTLTANVENGRILATGAADLSGNELDNLLLAGAGNNLLNGGTGTDTVSYATAASGVTISLALGTAQITGGSGSDTLVSIENLKGSAFDDTLVGNDGANSLDGGAGQDSLTGGVGNDVFVFAAAAHTGNAAGTADVVTDFTAGDRLDLSAIDADASTGLDDAFSDTLVSDFTAPGQLKLLDGVLYGNTDGDVGTAEFAIALTGVTALAGTDFIL